LDTDGVWPSCINVARKNYALVTAKGKIKLSSDFDKPLDEFKEYM